MKTNCRRRENMLTKARNVCRLAGACALLAVPSAAFAQAGGPLTAASPPQSLTGHRGAVYGVAFAPDGKTLASIGKDGSIRLWDAQSGKETRQFTRPNSPVVELRAVAFSPDGAMLAVGDVQGQLRLWEVQSGKIQREPILFGGTGAVKWIVYAPDGKTLVSVHATSDDARRDTVLLRDARTLEIRHICTDNARVVNSVAFSHDGALLAVGSSQGVGDYSSYADLYQVETGKRLHTLGNFRSRDTLIAFAPGEDTAAVCGLNYLYAVDVQLALRRGWYLPGNGIVRWRVNEDRVTALLYAPDGRTIASLGDSRKHNHGGIRLRLWKAANGVLERELTGYGEINGLAYAPDGKTLAGAGEDGTIRLWNTDGPVR